MWARIEPLPYAGIRWEFLPQQLGFRLGDDMLATAAHRPLLRVMAGDRSGGGPLDAS